MSVSRCSLLLICYVAGIACHIAVWRGKNDVGEVVPPNIIITDEVAELLPPNIGENEATAAAPAAGSTTASTADVDKFSTKKDTADAMAVSNQQNIKCAQIGERCVFHGDCCTNSCLGYTKRCVS